MAEAFVFINTFRVKEGRLDEYSQFVGRMVTAVAEGEPDMLQLGFFLDEETLGATALQVHRTVENFAVHLSLMSRFIEESRDFIDFSEMSVRICGRPTESILQQMRQMAGVGVDVSISKEIAGFDRYDS